MITDVFITLGSAVITIITKLFGLISFAVPDWVEQVIATGFSYFGRLQPIFPMVADPAKSGLWATVGILDMFSFGLLLIISIYIVKPILGVIQLLPFIGRKFHMPKIDH